MLRFESLCTNYAPSDCYVLCSPNKSSRCFTLKQVRHGDSGQWKVVRWARRNGLVLKGRAKLERNRDVHFSLSMIQWTLSWSADCHSTPSPACHRSDCRNRHDGHCLRRMGTCSVRHRNTSPTSTRPKSSRQMKSALCCLFPCAGTVPASTIGL